MKRFSGEQPLQDGPVPVQRGVLPIPGQSRSSAGKVHAPFLPTALADLDPRDWWHVMCCQALQGHYLAPLALGEHRRFLDVGTGTGRWAREMAQAFPNVAVYGLDLEEHLGAPSHTPTRNAPANYHFQPGNILKRLPFVEGSFDFVHQRFLLSATPYAQWYAVLRELLRVTRPGGWIELIESGNVVTNAGNATTRWLAWWEAEAARSGLAPAQIPTLGTLAQRTGLVCSQFTLDLPLGTWGGPLGELLQQSRLTDVDEMLKRTQQRGAVSPDLFAFRARLPDEWQTRRCQFRVFLVLAEKKTPQG